MIRKWEPKNSGNILSLFFLITQLMIQCKNNVSSFSSYLCTYKYSISSKVCNARAHCFRARFILCKCKLLKLDSCASPLWSEEQGEVINQDVCGQAADQKVILTQQQICKSFSFVFFFGWLVGWLQLWHKNKNNLIAADLKRLCDSGGLDWCPAGSL